MHIMKRLCNKISFLSSVISKLPNKNILNLVRGRDIENSGFHFAYPRFTTLWFYYLTWFFKDLCILYTLELKLNFVLEDTLLSLMNI